MEKEKFSLLLLEPGEIYFEDFSVDLLQSDERNHSTESPVISSYDSSSNASSLIGRLKMCSKSVVFQAKDHPRLPLIKIAYKDCLQIRRWDSASARTLECNVLAIECSQYTEMLKDNVVQPYNFRQHRRFFLFNFHYAKLEDYVQQLCQLHRASTLPAYEQNSMIATIVFSRHNRVRFNPLWLDNLYEKIAVECQVDEINPLVVNPGRLLLTNVFLYFQPYNNIQTYPVLKIRLKLIKSFLKRRFLLRHVGLEVRWSQNDQEKLLYVSFRNQAERDDFYNKVSKQEDFSVDEPIPESITLKWQNGLISNYEYLLYLNSLADRTYQDLTQYPVFPWVISDYSSDWLDLSDPKVYRDLTKPVGALNEERLQRLKERCDEMGDPKFLYGSHYSAPGLVLFYLVRKFPKLMLCLQNGRFDHPDRMFNRVEDVFNNCLNNMADFKELIPEFYDTDTKGDFLLNTMKINFGQRFDGTLVNHVILPKWADGNPEKFVGLLREALESDYVSSTLHHWIDLIFGYKQRGDEALEADNLFYYLCYEGSVDLDQIKDLAARHALEVQISEFGQIPKQLFRTPHVSKLMVNAPLESSRTSSLNKELRITMDAQYFSHKDEITSMLLDDSTKNIFTTSRDGTFKCYSLVEKRQIRSVQISDMPLSAIRLTNGNSVILGCWDNSIIIYNLDYGKISQVIAAHDDAVSCLSSVEGSEILVSGSWDCSVKIWNNFHIDSVIGYLPLEDKIVCLDMFQSDCDLRVAIGTACGELFLWKLGLKLDRSGQSLPDIDSQDHKLILQHKDAVCVVKFNRNCSLVVCCGEDRMFYIVDIETGMVIFQREMAMAIRSLSWAKHDKYLLMGDCGGTMYVWNMLDGLIQKEVRVHSGCIYCVGCMENSLIITSGKDDRDYNVKIWESNL
ncbi:protein FAN-like [Armigeres subalbatus]|uniref:protein FAN-like n=1 Tax=Armigeres subalbatus TaxID=124917 RepID=UPI002ED5BAB9